MFAPRPPSIVTVVPEWAVKLMLPCCSSTALTPENTILGEMPAAASSECDRSGVPQRSRSRSARIGRVGRIVLSRDDQVADHDQQRLLDRLVPVGRPQRDPRDAGRRRSFPWIVAVPSPLSTKLRPGEGSVPVFSVGIGGKSFVVTVNEPLADVSK